MKLLCTLLLNFACLLSFGQEVDSAWIASNRFPRYTKDTGRVLPSLTFRDEKGNKRTLEEFRGKILYIDVWATNCAPCIVLFSHAEQLKKRMQVAWIDSNIQFINICIDESPTKWKKILKKYQPAGINLYCADSSIYQLWDIDPVPRYLLVDATGKIMCYNLARPDDGSIDFALYAATKGIKPAESVWIEYRQYQYYRIHKRYTDDEEGTDYTRWYQSIKNELIEYFKWKQARIINSK